MTKSVVTKTLAHHFPMCVLLWNCQIKGNRPCQLPAKAIVPIYILTNTDLPGFWIFANAIGKCFLIVLIFISLISEAQYLFEWLGVSLFCDLSILIISLLYCVILLYCSSIFF